MEVHVCLNHCERGLFITMKENLEKHSPKENTRVEPDLEKKILDEFEKADFELINDDLSIAKTKNFIFRKYNEETEGKVIWVEPENKSLSNTVIL